VEAQFQGLAQDVWQRFEWFVTNSRGMDQDVASLSLGWGERRVIYDCDAKRGSGKIISVEGIIFRCWNETCSIGNFVPDCAREVSGTLLPTTKTPVLITRASLHL
jgi:hypothetical protein